MPQSKIIMIAALAALIGVLPDPVWSEFTVVYPKAGLEREEESTQLFPFESHRFTACGANGAYGPSVGDCQAAYDWSRWLPRSLAASGHARER